MSKQNQKNDLGPMGKIAAFIVDKRYLIFLITVLGVIFSAVSSTWVEVENDLKAYLPDDSETRQGLNVMDEQFTTFGTAKVMVANISLDEARLLSDTIAQVKGVQSVAFDDTTDHYNNVSALYDITFDYSEKDEACLEPLEKVKETLAGYDVYVSTDLGNAMGDIIDREVQIIMVLVAVIVVAVLIFTSQTYAEVPVLLITFVVAMILNSGTNFLLGKISFVSKSVTSILQLALSLDYAVILCNRFKEEREALPLREAVIVALSKGIPEIGSSSLTTIGGLLGMLFMQFKIGGDMGICLMKAIFFALLSVFVLMPGLLMLFGPMMDKTKHKTFVPKVPFIGKFAYATRKIFPPVFVVLLAFGYLFSSRCPYAYGYDAIVTPKLNETQIAANMIRENFSNKNLVALVVPAGDYEKEGRLLAELEEYDQVDSTLGLSNVHALGDYVLTDRLTPRQFAEMTELDYELAQVAYGAYAVKNDQYGQLIGGMSSYKVPLIDMVLFLCDQIDQGAVSLEPQQQEMLTGLQSQMENAKLQLQGPDYSRMLLYLDLPGGDDASYQFLDTIRETAQSYYPEGNVYVTGNLTSEYDFQKSFARDNVVVNIVTILIVLTVLLFTFRSVGMPLLLIMVIQGSIWLNFAFPTLTDSPLMFMSCLVVSSIQMGANIDYAIVIASRYMDLKDKISHREAIIETMNFAFPTILTSGTILAVSGILIGQMTSDATIVGIGQSLGRGTLISIALVMFVLPQILLLGASLIDRTSFSIHTSLQRRSASGRIRVDGLVRGEVHGTISGIFHGFVDGDANLNVLSGTMDETAAGELPAADAGPAETEDTQDPTDKEAADHE